MKIRLWRHSTFTLFLCLLSYPAYGVASSAPSPSFHSVDLHRQSTIANWKEPVDPGETRFPDFNPGLLHLLDAEKNVFLFRGNVPEQNGCFAYMPIKEGVKKVLLEQGISIADEFQIMVISFLNYVYEHKELHIEKEWFRQHPQTGRFWDYSLFGSFINPLELSSAARKAVLRYHDVDGLKALMVDLENLMHASANSNLVIYIHCMAGKDRTGEAAASYLMQFKGYSYKEALAYDEQVAGRSLRHPSVNAIRWYAFYLRDIKGCHWIGEID